MQFTVTETWWVEECAKAEELALKRAITYEQLSYDPQVKQVCHEAEQMHRRHIDMIAGLIGGQQQMI